MRLARTAAVGTLIVGLIAGCNGTDDDEPVDGPVALPEEAAERTDTATYVAPGEAFAVDVPSDWGFEESGPRVTARPPGGNDTPVVYIDRVPVGEEDFDLDAYVASQVSESQVPVDVTEVDIPGASEARLIEQRYDEGGRTSLIALDRDRDGSVVIDVVWMPGELDFDTAGTIARSLRFGGADGDEA